MQNKVTAKDVAREAGVSVATVSYVLNGRTDQKISPETKKKILQIANLMNYVPSHAAKSLATGRNNTIGISYRLSSTPTKDTRILSFVSELTGRLNRMKYDVTYIPSSKTDSQLPVNRNIDAIIAIDLTHDDFRVIADSYLVPVICVDMQVNDTLFYQIYEDVPFLIEKAKTELAIQKDYYFVYDSYENSAYENFIINADEAMIPIRSRELTSAMLEQLITKPTIVLGSFLALEVLAKAPASTICAIVSQGEETLLPINTRYVLNNEQKKANVTMNIVMNAIDRNFDLTHDHKIR